METELLNLSNVNPPLGLSTSLIYMTNYYEFICCKKQELCFYL